MKKLSIFALLITVLSISAFAQPNGKNKKDKEKNLFVVINGKKIPIDSAYLLISRMTLKEFNTVCDKQPKLIQGYLTTSYIDSLKTEFSSKDVSKLLKDKPTEKIPLESLYKLIPKMSVDEFNSLYSTQTKQRQSALFKKYIDTAKLSEKDFQKVLEGKTRELQRYGVFGDFNGWKTGFLIEKQDSTVDVEKQCASILKTLWNVLLIPELKQFQIELLNYLQTIAKNKGEIMLVIETRNKVTEFYKSINQTISFD